MIRNRVLLLWPLLLRFVPMAKELRNLAEKRIHYILLHHSAQKIAAQNKSIALHEAKLSNLGRKMYQDLKLFYKKLDQFKYPYSHAQGQVTLQVSIAAEYDEQQEHPFYCVEAINSFESRFDTLMGRIYLELTEAAEKVETTIGSPVLPTPPEKKAIKKKRKNLKKKVFLRNYCPSHEMINLYCM